VRRVRGVITPDAYRRENIMTEFTKNIIEKRSYRLTKHEDYALSRVGVFNTIPQIDIPELMIGQKLPNCYLSTEHDANMSLVSSNLQRIKLRSVKTEKKIKYSGSRRQRKFVTTTLISSEIIFTEHVVKRIYERSNLRGLSALHFHIECSRYQGELNSTISGLVYDPSKEIFCERQDLLYPFKTGAFLGAIRINPNPKVQRYRHTSSGEITALHDLSGQMNVFVARTFISYEMMNKQQKEVYNLWRLGNYRSAAQVMCRMNASQNNVLEFSVGSMPVHHFDVNTCGLGDSDAA
jgi:hypothetical protein